MSKSNSEQLAYLSEKLCDNYEGLLDILQVNLEDSGKYYVGCCPIHCGDNRTALNLFKDGHTMKGNWVCRTKQCETSFKPTILGFVRGVLSSKNGWSDSSDKNKVVPFYQVLNWVQDFLKIDINKIDVAKSEARKCIAIDRSINKKRIVTSGFEREKVLSCLSIPSPYFIKRGFSEEILRSYDVGLCLKSNRGFLERSIIPVYDEYGKSVVAYTGRSIYDACYKCNSYHHPLKDCPPLKYRQMYSKWKHSPNINNYLYNYWKSKSEIKKRNKIILTEGPLDCLKLEQAGIKNSVSIFGTSVSEQQELILELSGAFSLILLLDNDEAGRKGCDKIKEKLSKSYNIIVPKYNGKDIGDLSTEQIHNIKGLK